MNKDKEGLKSVFSKHIEETHDLDKEIDEFFEFIDGNIISYDEPKCNDMVVIGSIDFEGREDLYEGVRIGVKNNRKDLIGKFVFDEDQHTVWIIWDKKEEGWFETISNHIASSNNVDGM